MRLWLRTKNGLPFGRQYVWSRVMSRHGQELTLGVQCRDIDVPTSTRIPFLLLVAASRRYRGRPAARTVVLVDSPLVKTGPISPDSGRWICLSVENTPRLGREIGGSSVGAGKGRCCSRCFEPILLLHYPPHLVKSLALILVQAEDRRPVLQPFFGHLSLNYPGLHAGMAWSPVLGSCGPAWGRPARAARGIRVWLAAEFLPRTICLLRIGTGRQGYGRMTREEEHHRSSGMEVNGRPARRTWGREEGMGRWYTLRTIDNYIGTRITRLAMTHSTLKRTDPCPWSLTWPW